VPRLINTYGGIPEDWAKTFGKQYVTHELQKSEQWYENVKTGERVEFKEKFTGWATPKGGQ
jgi:hypothetical protein